MFFAILPETTLIAARSPISSSRSAVVIAMLFMDFPPFCGCIGILSTHHTGGSASKWSAVFSEFEKYFREIEVLLSVVHR